MTMAVIALACLCFVFSSVYAQSTTLASCKEEVCCNKQATPYLTSCKDIKKKWNNSPSGYYQLGTRRGPVSMYCNMEELCDSTGGWTRIGYFNMAEANVCPSGFRLHESKDVRACGRPESNSGSCASIKILSNDIRYSEVCGRVVGYQYASTDAIAIHRDRNSHNDINSFYVDGVSITHGFYRQHVWTLMSGLNSIFHLDGYPDYSCPCSLNGPPVQSFINNDYFCESGNHASNKSHAYDFVFYANDTLWDGKGCSSLEGACCAAPGLPWFHKTLDNATTDYIELRVCGDEGTANEDTPIAFYEIYIK